MSLTAHVLSTLSDADLQARIDSCVQVLYSGGPNWDSAFRIAAAAMVEQDNRKDSA